MTSVSMMNLMVLSQLVPLKPSMAQDLRKYWPSSLLIESQCLCIIPLKHCFVIRPLTQFICLHPFVGVLIVDLPGKINFSLKYAKLSITSGLSYYSNTFWVIQILPLVNNKKQSCAVDSRRCPWCNGYRCLKMNTVTQVQILDETDCISYSTNTLGKGMNPIILPPAMGK